MMLKIEFFTLLRALVCQVEAQGDAQAHPCDAHPRHPCLKKPPELQPDTPNHLYVIPYLKVKEQKTVQKQL